MTDTLPEQQRSGGVELIEQKRVSVSSIARLNLLLIIITIRLYLVFCFAKRFVVAVHVDCRDVQNVFA